MSSSDASPPSSVPEEVSEARGLFPSVRVLTSTPSFLIATYERSPYTRVKMTLSFPEGYPSHSLIVSIDQDAVVPPGLKKKLEKEMNSVASERAKIDGGEHYDQVRAVWDHLVSFVDTNLFVPCWKELKKSVDLVQSSNDDTVAAANTKQSTISIVSESEGKLKLNLYAEAYYYRCTITIDPAYPDYSPANEGKSCLLKVTSTNFPSTIQNMLTSQALEIVRRMQEGLSSERALQMSNPIKVPKNFHINTEEFKESNKARLTNDTIQSIKHDTEALKRVSDLRKNEAAATRAPGDNGYVDTKALAKERKDARRTIQKITEEERAADRKAEEKEKEWVLDEKKRMAGYYDLYNVPTGGTIQPQPSLFVLITFLIERVRGLVKQVCPCCKERVLPADPAELSSMYCKKDECKSKEPSSPSSSKCRKKMKPMRTYCGCWYHKSCLNTFLTEPPFGIECPTANCGRRVFHPDWPGDIKVLEREWAARQARMREIEDAMLFL